MKYILAHDLGTSGNKATLFSEEGRLVTSEVHSYDCHYFNANWAEQNPEDWWNAICVTTKNLIDKAGIDAGDIAVVSFSGQMMGCLCVDREGNPLRPSIIWADQRAQAQAAAIEKEIPLRDFYRIAGHRNSASYGIQKLMWVRDNEPEVYARTYKTLNAKDFIVLRLTGKWYTEPSDATSNACIDLETLQWSEKIVAASGIDGDKLPEIVPSTTVAGEVTKWAAERTGLKPGTAVVMGGGDGLCSNVGAGSISPGRTFCCIGSSAWVATTSSKPLFDEQMRTFTWAHIVPGLYSPTGTMQSGGGAYQWLKQRLGKYETAAAQAEGKSPYQLIDQEAAKSPAGSNGVIFLPYLLGERAPRWNPNATAAWLGLKMENERSDIFRSVMDTLEYRHGGGDAEPEYHSGVLPQEHPHRRAAHCGRRRKGEGLVPDAGGCVQRADQGPHPPGGGHQHGRCRHRRRGRGDLQGFHRHRPDAGAQTGAGTGPGGRGRLRTGEGDF